MKGHTMRTGKLHHVTPRIRNLGNAKGLALEFTAASYDMQQLRTIYRALRTSGMSALSARLHIFNVLAGVGMYAKFPSRASA
jgi:hypothetical protein